MVTKRYLKACVLSDIHLGTYGCHAEELTHYLRSISPELLILNGDIIDIWNFRKKCFPSSHMQVIRTIMKMAESGTKVIYITGNHDEALRQYSDLHIHNFKLVDKYIFFLNGETYWVFHGDVFDSTTKGNAKLIAKLGGKGYDMLILMNRFVNHVLMTFGKKRMSFSRKVKNSVKRAVKWISDFENTAIELAIDQNYDYVICGHIHQPKIMRKELSEGSTVYMNSGDWVENLTALEHDGTTWDIFKYDERKSSTGTIIEDLIPKVDYAEINEVLTIFSQEKVTK